MKTPNEKETRRRWALDQIGTLKRQREGLDRRIGEFESFLALLDASETALRVNNNNMNRATLFAHEDARSLASHVEQALNEAGSSGLSIVETVERVRRMGYVHRAKKTSVKTAVSTELYRMAKAGRRGVRLLGRGRFAILHPADEAATGR